MGLTAAGLLVVAAPVSLRSKLEDPPEAGCKTGRVIFPGVVVILDIGLEAAPGCQPGKVKHLDIGQMSSRISRRLTAGQPGIIQTDIQRIVLSALKKPLV